MPLVLERRQPCLHLHFTNDNFEHSIGSGFPFPVPIHLAPLNISYWFRIFFSALWNPTVYAKLSWLRRNGIEETPDFLNIFSPDSLWISACAPESDFPLENIPPNVKSCGAIALNVQSAKEQDEAITNWLKGKRTVLVNLGSSVEYDERRATTICRAFKKILSESDVQILWKLKKYNPISNSTSSYDPSSPSGPEPYRTEDVIAATNLTSEVENGRLRIERWLNVDPTALLETGDIALSVHHGGANCYQEAILYALKPPILIQFGDS
jgi:hypothetical protein